MKYIFILLSLLIPSTLSILAQEVPNLPWVDISQNKGNQLVISQGTPELYNGHPTTVMLDDNKTIFCTWTYNHGGKVGFLAQSKDAGDSWNFLKIPEEWLSMRNCPSIYNLKDKKGKERLFIFAGEPQMGQTYSEDGGNTWSSVKSLGKPCVMTFSSIVKLKNGDYLGLYHRGFQDRDQKPLKIWQSISKDGGLTWGESVMVCEKEGYSPCEPYVFRSPDGEKLACVMRENNRKGKSLMMFSTDEGENWTKPVETPWGLTGDRHIIKFVPDGRMVAVFRDMAPNSPTKGHFVAWVGNYKDLIENTSGQYKIKLLHSYAGSDCGYPGLEVLPDGTIVAITYIKMTPGTAKHSIVQVKFKLKDTDELLGLSR